MKHLLLTCLVILVFSNIFVSGFDNWDDILADEPVDKSHWVDPNDMGFDLPKPKPVAPVLKARQKDLKNNVKPNLKTTKDPVSSGPTRDKGLTGSNEDLSVSLGPPRDPVSSGSNEDLSSSGSTPNIAQEEKCSKPPRETPIEETLYFRFVKHLLDRFKLASVIDPANSNQVFSFVTMFEFTEPQISTLQKFVKERKIVKSDKERLGLLHSVDSVLRSMISSVSMAPVRDWTEVVLEFISKLQVFLPESKDMVNVILACGAIIFLYLFWLDVPIRKCFGFVFIISFFWQWYYMMKKSMVEKHTTLTKHTKMGGVPSECSREPTWGEYFFGSGDKCKSYYAALLIDPTLEVTPTKALAETITVIIVQPLEHVGLHVGKFFNALMGQLSWYQMIPVLTIVTFLIVIIILVAFNYQIRMPFGIFTLGPHQQTGNQLTARIQQLEEENHRLQQSNASLESEKRTDNEHIRQLSKEQADLLKLEARRRCTETLPLMPPSETKKIESNQEVEDLRKQLEQMKISLSQIKTEQTENANQETPHLVQSATKSSLHCTQLVEHIKTGRTVLLVAEDSNSSKPDHVETQSSAASLEPTNEIRAKQPKATLHCTQLDEHIKTGRTLLLVAEDSSSSKPNHVETQSSAASLEPTNEIRSKQPSEILLANESLPENSDIASACGGDRKDIFSTSYDSQKDGEIIEKFIQDDGFEFVPRET